METRCRVVCSLDLMESNFARACHRKRVQIEGAMGTHWIPREGRDITRRQRAYDRFVACAETRLLLLASRMKEESDDTFKRLIEGNRVE